MMFLSIIKAESLAAYRFSDLKKKKHKWNEIKVGWNGRVALNCQKKGKFNAIKTQQCFVSNKQNVHIQTLDLGDNFLEDD